MVPARLRLGAVPEFVDDVGRGLSWRLGKYRQWLDAFESWKGAREAWSAAHGWPGGEEERLREELDYGLPDAPFDPSDI